MLLCLHSILLQSQRHLKIHVSFSSKFLYAKSSNHIYYSSSDHILNLTCREK